MEEREIAYQKYINEVTQNGNDRITNMMLSLGDNGEYHRHIAAQADLAFQAGWNAALAAVRKLDEI